jgi:hypothetical protein
VLVIGETDSGKALGSGFLISSDGRIATNLHVIRDLNSGGVQLASGEKFDSFSVLAFDEHRDLAIIKIPGFDLPSVSLGNSNELEVGEPVLTMGSPLGLQGSVTTGVVSSIRDDPFGGGFKVIQTDASVNPGNSGGPLVSAKQTVVGIIRYKVGGTENLSFAVPVNYLRGMLDPPASPISLEELRAKLTETTDIFQAVEGVPERWKSLLTGTTKLIRRDGDRLYVETIYHSDVDKQLGCFANADLKKTGSSYSGTVNESCNCQTYYWFTHQTFISRWSIQSPMTLTTITPTRIEGWTMGPAKGNVIDCAKGRYSRPLVKQTFVWIPE